MAAPERSFTLGAILMTLVVPGLLIVGRPFAESGSTMGVVVGWGLALLVIVPSFFLMRRVMGSQDNHRFYRNFMVGVIGRFAGSIMGVVLFYVLVPDPPLWSFVLSFFLGYALLSTLEVLLLLKKSPESSSAPSQTPDRTHA